MEKVAIVGYGMSPQADIIKDSREGMIFSTVKQTLEAHDIKRDDISTWVMCSNDFYDGRTISNVFTVDPSGAYGKDETKVEQDGMHALLYAWMRVASGNHEMAIVVAHSKGSEFEPHVALSAQLDPTYDRQFGFLNDIAAAALQARAYLAKNKLDEDVLAEVAFKNLSNAEKNPLASVRKKGLSVKDIAQSPELFSPLREMTSYPATDGCCVAVLANEKKARKITKKPVWITGFGHCQEAYYLGERDLTRIRSAKDAARRAYKMAGIKDPAKDIDVFEVSEHFAHQELMLYEALGLSEPGKAAKLLNKGKTELKGAIPVNPSGGALAACALGTVGLVRAVECAMQIRGEAGKHQVKKAKTALAHGQCGMAAQNNIVAILKGFRL